MSLLEARERAQAEWKRLQNGGRVRVYLDTGSYGRSAGSLPVYERFASDFASRNIAAQIIPVGTLGCREIEPLAGIAKPGWPRIYYPNLTVALASELVASCIVGNDPRPDLALGTDASNGFAGIPPLASLPPFRSQVRVALRHCGQIDPEDIHHYLANGGYGGFTQALTMPPEELLDAIEQAGLRGRGGAGFPAAQKWRVCRHAESSPKYVICNAAEGAPEACKDEVLLEGDPHAVLEGLLIAAYAVGASRGYIYINPDCRVAIRRLGVALEQMKTLQLLGENILSSNFSFALEVREANRGFAGGEETVLLSSLEGRLPRAYARPPYPATAGLRSRPTLVHNVETLAHVSAILQKGVAWYRALGTRKCPGTKLVTLSGRLQRSGVAEVPMGTPLRQIVTEIAGGALPGDELKAVQVGGPTGGWVPADQLDIALDFEELRGAGCVMGNGSIVAADTHACAVDLARRAASFAHSESCGKCTFGREGTRQLRDVLTDVATGQGAPADLQLLLTLGDGMKAGSLCAHGRTAPDAVLTTLQHFRPEYEAHVSLKRCPAGVCS
jgi:NADH:ubiquinone oxidoreductase subunit F (NADH-binding)